MYIDVIPFSYIRNHEGTKLQSPTILRTIVQKPCLCNKVAMRKKGIPMLVGTNWGTKKILIVPYVISGSHSICLNKLAITVKSIIFK